MPIRLPFTTYRFTFKAEESIPFPAYSGTLWHAVIGKALHGISCIVPQGDCQHCLLTAQCDYPILFKGVKFNGSTKMQHYPSIPVPHIIRVQHPHAHTVNAQQSFSIEVILIGQRNDKLGRLIHAMQTVAANGFRNARKKAQLLHVVQLNASGLDQMLALDQPNTPQSVASLPVIPPLSTQQLRLTLLNPFRPTGKAIRSTTFLLDKLIMGLIRRISLLQYFYTGVSLDEDFLALKAHAEQLPVLAQTMQWHYHETLAKRRNQHRQGYAWSGSIDIDLSHHEHQALWPYLYIGQWLHVGKNASMGFGRYELTAIPSTKTA